MTEIEKANSGSIKIHKKVLAEITAAAVKEVSGVRLAAMDLWSTVGNLFGGENFPGISIKGDRNSQLTIEVRVFIRYGLHIPDVARQTQDSVRQAIERTVDIDLKDVNVNIQGIEKVK